MRDDEWQAEQDASVARHLAADSLLREGGPPLAGARAARGPADAVEGYAMQLLDHLDGSVPRALLAAQAACVHAAGEVAHPSRWHTAIRAVEICRHAAHLGGHVPPADDQAPPG